MRRRYSRRPEPRTFSLVCSGLWTYYYCIIARTPLNAVDAFGGVGIWQHHGVTTHRPSVHYDSPYQQKARLNEENRLHTTDPTSTVLFGSKSQAQEEQSTPERSGAGVGTFTSRRDGGLRSSQMRNGVTPSESPLKSPHKISSTRFSRSSITSSALPATISGGASDEPYEEDQLQSRQRNPKSESSSSATAATTTTTTTTTTSSRSRSAAAASTNTHWGMRDSLKHRLLTKQQEYKLGCAIQRANQVKDTVALYLCEKQQQQDESDQLELRTLKFMSLHGNNHYNNYELEDESDDESDDEDEDMKRLTFVYQLGRNNKNEDVEEKWQNRHRQAYLAQTEIQRLRWDDSNYRMLRSLSEGSNERNLVRATTKSKRSRTRQEDNELHRSASRQDIAVRLDKDWQILQSLSNQEWQALGIPGGIKELRLVLQRGSLARQYLMENNIKLVVNIATRWSQYSSRNSIDSPQASLPSAQLEKWGRPSLEEAIQEGIIGLADAVVRFQPQKNFRFSTYATYWITNSVRQCFQRAVTGPIRLPVKYHDTKRSYLRLVKEFYSDDDDGEQSDRVKSFPTREEFAQRLGVSVKRLDHVMMMTRPLSSIDDPLNQSPRAKADSISIADRWTLSDALVDLEFTAEDHIELSFLRQTLEVAMATELAPHERTTLRLLWGWDDGVTRTQKEVAGLLGNGYSSTDVRRWEHHAYKKLRSPQSLSTHQLMAYLDLAGADQATINYR